MNPANTRPGSGPPAIMTVGEASKWSGLDGVHLRDDLATWLDGKGVKMLGGVR
jgi:hypothetical protein